MNRAEFLQGSDAWLAHRATHFNASDAPAMLGCSPYKTRTQLLHELHTGIAPEVDAATQRRFDDGHRFEALARPLAEEIIGDDLAPVVGFEGELSASFDGLTFMADTAWEHKTLNDELRGCMGPYCIGRDLPKVYRVQMEQQLLVSGAGRVLFMATKWTPSGEITEQRHCWYESDPALRAEIVAGWYQFADDLAAYRPAEAAPVVTAQVAASLPAVSVRMDGALTVVSNLDKLEPLLRAFIERIPAQPSTDQEFADTDAACKTLKRIEDELDASEASALASLEAVEQMQRLKKTLHALARSTRLQREKLVESRKAQIRTDEVQRGKEALNVHLVALNTAIGKPYMPAVPADFAAAIKGKKTIDSLRNAIDTELARAKAAATTIHSSIMINMLALRELAAEHAFLFADTAQLVLKAPDDCRAAITSRIAQHKESEGKRIAAEREAIRAEEAAKLQREQAEATRLAAEAAKPAATPAPAPVAAPAPAPVVAAPPPNVVPIASPSGERMWSATRVRIGLVLDRMTLDELFAVEGFIAERAQVAA